MAIKSIDRQDEVQALRAGREKRPTLNLTLGSLFAGIGGFELGFERAEIRTVWQVEIDEWCQKILAKHFPEAQRFGDIRSVGAHCLAPVDIISAGFPCSDISPAGRRRGIAEGTQSGLWKEAIRVVRELGPRYVVVENVAVIARRGLALVLGDLYKAGFDAEWTVISARDFGLPHLRQRLFVVAYPPWPGETEGPQVFKHEWRPKLADTHGVRLVAGANGAGEDASARQEACGTRPSPSGHAPGDGCAGVQQLADSAGVGLHQASVFAEGSGEQETVRGGEQAGRRGGNPGDGGCGVLQVAHAAGESGVPREVFGGADSGGRVEEAPAGRQVEDGGWGLLSSYRGSSGRVWLAPEQSFVALAHELPEELARLKACGNAVVPAATEWVARRILKREAELAKR
jgi:site-specific DNA-cytosine methylase